MPNLAHRSTLRIERRPSDFQSGTALPASGGCCCCCCLHWVGAAVGGMVALPLLAVHTRRRSRELHPKAKLALWLGATAGIVLTAAVVATAIYFMQQQIVIAGGVGPPAVVPFVIAVAIVPSLVLLPIGGAMILATWWLRIVSPLPDSAGGVYCRKCSYDLRGSVPTACPQCGASLRLARVRPGQASGFLFACHFTWLSFFLCGILVWPASYHLGEPFPVSPLSVPLAGMAAILLALLIVRRRKRRRLHPGPRALLTGALGGALAYAAWCAAAQGMMKNNALLAVAPWWPLIFLPIGGGMMLAPLWSRRKRDAEPRLTCSSCATDLQSLARASCPECGTLVKVADLRPGVEYGIRHAWYFTWMSVVLSTVLSGVGYLIMIPFLD